MTEAQKQAMAKANVEASNEAHRLAAEQTARDIAEGKREAPVATVVAGSILEKLKNLPPEKPAE